MATDGSSVTQQDMDEGQKALLWEMCNVSLTLLNRQYERILIFRILRLYGENWKKGLHLLEDNLATKKMKSNYLFYSL